MAPIRARRLSASRLLLEGSADDLAQCLVEVGGPFERVEEGGLVDLRVGFN